MDWNLDDETQAWTVFMAWVNERPESIRKIALKYPPGVYKVEMNDGTPSMLTHCLIGYDEYEDGSEPTAILDTEDGISLVRNVALDKLIPVDTMNTRFEKLMHSVMERAKDVADDQLRDILNYLERKAEEEK